LLVVAAAAIAAGIAAIDPSPVGAVHDDAGYVVLARSLATGHGYRNLNLPGSPASIHVPPGYPAFLALLWWANPDFPSNLVLFKAANLLLLGVAAADHRFAASRVFGQHGQWVGVISAISVPMLIFGASRCPSVVLLVVIALAGAGVIAERPSTVWRALLVGAGIAVCSLVRSHGIALPPGRVLVFTCAADGRCGAGDGGDHCLSHPGKWVGPHEGSAGTGAYTRHASWLCGAREMGAAMIPATLARTAPESTRTLPPCFHRSPTLRTRRDHRVAAGLSVAGSGRHGGLQRRCCSRPDILPSCCLALSTDAIHQTLAADPSRHRCGARTR
jgi:hypothetical protein